jgi:regulator of replication initiation timing
MSFITCEDKQLPPIPLSNDKQGMNSEQHVRRGFNHVQRQPRSKDIQIQLEETQKENSRLWFEIEKLRKDHGDKVREVEALQAHNEECRTELAEQKYLIEKIAEKITFAFKEYQETTQRFGTIKVYPPAGHQSMNGEIVSGYQDLVSVWSDGASENEG